MSYPGDVLLPLSAKYFGMIDSKNAYNSHWDITWSFTYALTGSQHGFCTFLTTNPTLSSGIPGHYLGYLGNIEYLLSDSGEILLSESGDRLLVDSASLSGYDVNGVLAIAFDSTGLFALSSTTSAGVSLNGVKQNSLIIRDSNTNILLNEHLSSLDTSFILSSSVKTSQTLRFRFANAGKKLHIDFKRPLEDYKTLASISISSFKADSNPILYPGFTFCSPISSSSITPSTMYLSNFHTQGNTLDPTYEVIPSTSLNPELSTGYTTIPGVSAYPQI